MWPEVHSQVVIGLIIAQVVVTFVFAIKKSIWAAVITAITILVSFIFNAVVKKRFLPPQQNVSFRGAADGDHADEASAGFRAGVLVSYMALPRQPC